MKTPQQISLFLLYLKKFVEKNGLIVVPRKATIEYMSERNVTPEVLKQLVLRLEAKDCFDGPEPDRDPKRAGNWTVAKFSPSYRNEKLYLKLSVRMDAERAKCLSVKLYTEREV